MKKKTRKIQLSRETLTRLNGSSGEPGQVVSDSYCSPECINCTSWGMGYEQGYEQMICPQFPY